MRQRSKFETLSKKCILHLFVICFYWKRLSIVRLSVFWLSTSLLQLQQLKISISVFVRAILFFVQSSFSRKFSCVIGIFTVYHDEKFLIALKRSSLLINHIRFDSSRFSSLDWSFVVLFVSNNCHCIVFTLRIWVLSRFLSKIAPFLSFLRHRVCFVFYNWPSHFSCKAVGFQTRLDLYNKMIRLFFFEQKMASSKLIFPDIFWEKLDKRLISQVSDHWVTLLRQSNATSSGYYQQACTSIFCFTFSVETDSCAARWSHIMHDKRSFFSMKF